MGALMRRSRELWELQKVRKPPQAFWDPPEENGALEQGGVLEDRCACVCVCVVCVPVKRGT